MGWLGWKPVWFLRDLRPLSTAIEESSLNLLYSHSRGASGANHKVPTRKATYGRSTKQHLHYITSRSSRRIYSYSDFYVLPLKSVTDVNIPIGGLLLTPEIRFLGSTFT